MPLPRQSKEPDNPAGVYCEQINKYLVLVRNLSELIKQHFFCCLVPLALQALNPFKCERAHPLTYIATSYDWFSRGFIQQK